MKEILEKVHKIQKELFGRKSVFVNVYLGEEDSTLISVTVFADKEDDDDMKVFQFNGFNTKEKNDKVMKKLEAYVEYAKNI